MTKKLESGGLCNRLVLLHLATLHIVTFQLCPLMFRVHTYTHMLTSFMYYVIHLVRCILYLVFDTRNIPFTPVLPLRV